MAQNGYAKRGGQTILAGKLKKNRNSISMALSGFRCSRASEQLLKELKAFLTKVGQGAQ